MTVQELREGRKTYEKGTGGRRKTVSYQKGALSDRNSA